MPCVYIFPTSNIEARGDTVGWGTTLQTGRSRVRFPMVIGIFNWHNPSSCTKALELTELTEMSTRNISWGVKAAGAQGWLTLPPSWNLGASTSWDSQGLSLPVIGLLYVFYIEHYKNFRTHHTYRLARSRLTHFKFEYCAGAIACLGWREGER